MVKKLEMSSASFLQGIRHLGENYVNAYALRANFGFNVLERYGPDHFFKELKPLLLESDLVIANLETPLIDAKNTAKPSFSFYWCFK
jgi:hypothetical protein